MWSAGTCSWAQAGRRWPCTVNKYRSCLPTPTRQLGTAATTHRVARPGWCRMGEHPAAVGALYGALARCVPHDASTQPNLLQARPTDAAHLHQCAENAAALLCTRVHGRSLTPAEPPLAQMLQGMDPAGYGGVNTGPQAQPHAHAFQNCLHTILGEQGRQSQAEPARGAGAGCAPCCPLPPVVTPPSQRAAELPPTHRQRSSSQPVSSSTSRRQLVQLSLAPQVQASCSNRCCCRRHIAPTSLRACTA